MTPETVIDFWRKAGPDKWFGGGPDFDEACRSAFREAWTAARRGECEAWAETPEGALALVILLDQMPRNMFRGSAEVYASDLEARRAASRAIERGFDRAVDPTLRRFFYLPYMHSEDIADQRLSVALNGQVDADSLKWAQHHHDIVARFGRFPHRNAVLGRATTPDEAAYLADEGAFKG